MLKFEDFNNQKLNEDTLKHYEAWGKKIIIGCDNDANGGFIDVMVDGKQVGKVYVISTEELDKLKS